MFRWFIGLNLDDEVWDATVFTKNRDRLLEAEVAKEFLAHVVEQARVQGLTERQKATAAGRPRQSHCQLPRRAALE